MYFQGFHILYNQSFSRIFHNSSKVRNLLGPPHVCMYSKCLPNVCSDNHRLKGGNWIHRQLHISVCYSNCCYQIPIFSPSPSPRGRKKRYLKRLEGDGGIYPREQRVTGHQWRKRETDEICQVPKKTGEYKRQKELN
jgi:hypothetical protein